MIEAWYYCFLSCIAVLWAFSVPRDRNALRVVLIFSLTGIALVTCVTTHIHGAWKLAIHGAHDTLTILALLQWARTRSGYLNALVLCVAWVAHLFCYLDLFIGSERGWIYNHYETVIQVVAIGQILAFHETATHIFRTAPAWFGAIRGGGVRGVRVAGNCNCVLPDEAPQIHASGCSIKKKL